METGDIKSILNEKSKLAENTAESEKWSIMIARNCIPLIFRSDI